MSVIRDPWRAAESSAWTDGWHPSAKPVDRDLMRRRPLLVARSLDEHRNNPIPYGATSLLTEVVGYLQLRSRAKDPAIRARIQERWDEWTQRAGADDVSSLRDLAYQLTGSQCQSGDVLAILPHAGWADDNPLRVDLVDSLRVDSPADDALRQGYKVDNGVLIAPDRRVTGYFVAKEGKSLTSRALDDFLYFPRERQGRINARLCRRPNAARRPGQHREVPIIAPILLGLHDQYLYQKAAIRKAVLLSKINFMTTSPDPRQIAEAWSSVQSAPPEIKASMEACFSRSQTVLEDASGLNLSLGETVLFSPQQASDPNYGPFNLWLLKTFAAAWGMPHEVLWNLWSDANYSRARILIMRANAIAPTWHAAQIQDFYEPIFRTWLQYEVLLGRIPGVTSPEQLTPDISGHEWYAPPRESMDPETDLEAAKLRMQLGQRSEVDLAAIDGYDADEVDAERIAFRKRHKERLAEADLTEEDMRVGDPPPAKGRPAAAAPETTPKKPEAAE